MTYPIDWKHSTIDELCNQQNSLFTDGDWVESKDQDTNGSNRLIQLADIGDGVFIDKSSRFMNDEQFNRLNCTEMTKGDILIARMPEPLGRACLFPHIQRKCATVVDVAILRVSTVSHYWLMSLLNSAESRRYIKSNSSGSTRVRITKKALGEMYIPLPPLPEQKKIAEVLSTVDDKIDSIKQNIDQTRTLKKGLMQKLLTGQLSVTGTPHTFKDSKLGLIPKSWEVVKFVEIGAKHKHSIVDGPFGSNLKSEHYRSSGVPLIQSGFVTSNKFKAKKYFFVDEELFNEQIRSKVVAGDIVMAKIGARAGTSAILPQGHPDSIIAGNCLKISVMDGKALNRFVLLFLHYCYDKTELSELKTQTAQPALSLKSLRGSRISLPPLSEQEKIAEILGGVDDKLDVLEDKKEKYATLKKGLMQKLLTGKMRMTV